MNAEYADDDLVPISALEHYSYCPRQGALIHREQTFDENLYTLRGRAVHALVDEPGARQDRGVRVERALPLWSQELGLVGRADVVEFRDGVPYPVEYKSGAHSGRHADLQLCAQAMCLEEMLGVPVERGAVFEFARRKRREVLFTEELRQRVRQTVQEVRDALNRDPLPPVVADKRCPRCSLVDSCLPRVLASAARVRWHRSQLYSTDQEVRT